MQAPSSSHHPPPSHQPWYAARERQSVGGTKGGMARRDQMAEEHGGDAGAGYAEMGSKGGSSGQGDQEQEAA
jgi:hypothetical protein